MILLCGCRASCAYRTHTLWPENFQRPCILQAPAGRKIRVTINQITAAFGQLPCYLGCPFVGLEFVDNANGDLTTMGKMWKKKLKKFYYWEYDFIYNMVTPTKSQIRIFILYCRAAERHFFWKYFLLYFHLTYLYKFTITLRFCCTKDEKYSFVSQSNVIGWVSILWNLSMLICQQQPFHWCTRQLQIRFFGYGIK